MYLTIYAQPQDRYNLRRSLELIFRTATQGNKELRKLGDFSRFLPEILNPSLKGYFEALTQRDRFTAHIDEALEPGMYGFVPLLQPLRLLTVPLGVQLTLMADPILIQWQTELTPCLLILADILPW